MFVDKSVYTASEAKSDSYFSGISNSLSFEKDNFGNDNFMVALSALGSTSEVQGYSHTPTDTMLVLDASTSMGTGDVGNTATNLADKTFKFAKGVTFSEADTYYFVVTEKKGNLSYIRYDGTAYGITVKVIDDGLGKL